MSTCLVFTPDNPEVYTLNPTAWLILRLCDGRSIGKIVASYYSAVEPMLSRQEAEHEVSLGLDYLLRKQIVEVVEIAEQAGRRLHHGSR
jgi:Coenzyme PQQ synthesis protein D (PqqD)